jgi:two-component system sensor histidine kinase AlgZ
MTTIRNEVSLTRYYLEIEQLRLGDRLKIDWQIDDVLMDARIPGLVIQPLVENAVYHGIEPRTDGGAVNIAIQGDEKMHIRISNPLPSKDDHTLRRGNQVAISNIRERLQIAFGSSAMLKSSQDEREYEVAITIPVVKT